METPFPPAKRELVVGPCPFSLTAAPTKITGVTGIQQDWDPVSARPLAAWRNRSPGLESDEAREVLHHTGAAGQDNLPSVLSGFTPVLLVTPERGTAETPLIYCGEGRQGRGRNHLLPMGQPHNGGLIFHFY